MSKQRTRLDEILERQEKITTFRKSRGLTEQTDVDLMAALAVACRDAQGNLEWVRDYERSMGMGTGRTQAILDSLQPLLELQPVPGSSSDTGDMGGV